MCHVKGVRSLEHRELGPWLACGTTSAPAGSGPQRNRKGRADTENPHDTRGATVSIVDQPAALDPQVPRPVL